MNQPLEPGDALPDELFAWITEVDGRNCLVGIVTSHGHSPLVLSSLETAEKFEVFARAHAALLHQPVRLVRFIAAGVVK